MLGILEDHTGSVWSIELDSNGNYIVSAGNVVFLWDFSTDDIEKFTLDGPVGEVHAAAFSPDNRYVVAAGEDMAVYIWELATRRQVARLTGHTDEVWSLEISPDGKWIATGSTDQTIKIWDLNAAVRGTATSHRRPDPGAIAVIPFALGEEHTDTVRDVAFSPDGNLIATAGYDDSHEFLSSHQVRIDMNAPTTNCNTSSRSDFAGGRSPNRLSRSRLAISASSARTS